MDITQINIKVKDGYNLVATLREPLKYKKRVFVQIHCGTGIPQKLYANFAKYLTENGFTTLTFDYRGIGKSKPASLKNFDAKIRDWGQKDMVGVFDWVIDNFPDYKKVIVAHSLGGQMVGLMRNNNKINQLYLIASSTGYWRDMNSPYKWILPPIWFLFIPLSIKIYGFANAKKIKQGENLPKGVALEWRNWCINPTYFENEFDKTLSPLYFNKLKAPIKSIQILDDPIANEVTIGKLLDYYSNAKITKEKINPRDLGARKIGHVGYFSRKFKNTLWSNLVKDINNN
ncbi:MAG: alpha/beta fold hydrolase [Polaribacter sp.]|uniref:alpha/beta hydrolase family protein n=1 Tax=Polaribacter sp. TaxID=1920175 RepID=UPI003BAF367D